jgi:branched-chain amino acid transport system ATP-binding protein
MDAHAAATEILSKLHLTPLASLQADTLPTGLARLLELGRALATQPSVLLLDEPRSGLNSTETETLGELLLDVAAAGMAILLVEHDMELVMRVSEQLWVLDFGRIIATGAPSTVQADPAVRLA